MAITQGSHHIGLTVPNLIETRDFFVNILGFEQVGEVPILLVRVPLRLTPTRGRTATQLFSFPTVRSC